MDEKPIDTSLESACAKMRGNIIHYVVVTENYLNQIIAHYFCDSVDKANAFIYVILPSEKVPLMNKYKIFKYIAENFYPEFLKKYPTLSTDLKNLIETRNIFAHHSYIQWSDTNLNSKEGSITFTHFKTHNHKIHVAETTFTTEDIVGWAQKNIKYW